jgi:shikimate dehydrogenase
MKRYGLIGFPLTHTFSPSYFNQKFANENINAFYEAYPIESIQLIKELIASTENLIGLSVTIPYKTQVISYLDLISKEANSIGAVNCIKIINGQLYGFNTDFIGFIESLKPLLRENIKSALILGSGGSSQAVQYALTQLNIEYKIVSSSGHGNYSYQDLSEEIIANNLLIVNTTPLGMYPILDMLPSIPYQFLTKEHLLYDLIYNPERTLFLQKGLAQKTTIKNGIEMLHVQAEKSWEIWNNQQKDDDFIPVR